MKKKNSVIFWPPRLFAIFFILFVGLLSMDVFGVGYTFWETLIAFFMHNMATFALIIILIISWKWGHIGGLLWIGAGLWFMGMTVGNVPAGGIMLMSGIPITIGLLFVLQYFLEKSHK